MSRERVSGVKAHGISLSCASVSGVSMRGVRVSCVNLNNASDPDWERLLELKNIEGSRSSFAKFGEWWGDGRGNVCDVAMFGVFGVIQVPLGRVR